MDALPPNDPHRNAQHNPSKGDPSSSSTNRNTRNDGAMEVFGDIQDAPLVVAMFLVGVVTWFLREQCVC
jgi:hypothetical protein